jgi:hypothetical protein
MQPVGCEQAMEQLDHDRTLSDCGRHALRRAVLDVADREHPGTLVSSINGLPASRHVRSSRRSVPIRTKSGSSRWTCGWKPIRVRMPPIMRKSTSADGFLARMQGIGKHQLLQPPVTPAAGDLRPETDPHVRRGLHLTHQIVRHPSAERLST